MGVLTRQELEECNAAFDRFDQSKGGSISVTELRNLLKDINQLPDEDELFDLLLILNLDTSGSISRNQFIELVEQSKKKRIANIDEKGTIEAFVVCGGQQDKTGSVSTQKIAKVFKEFELSLDIDMDPSLWLNKLKLQLLLRRRKLKKARKNELFEYHHAQFHSLTSIYTTPFSLSLQPSKQNIQTI
ncbi:MAG: putative flagellar outer dynein arm light chain 5 [Streblomastix strix]|uniref:Putative flagellar outer dynein arm light chain 5 n=1 Tax=Streblomastix strix TaxID=222440 RepID=A0A5J4WCG3_9EUKA|nr:MAG: putative flagellar outer dynein arm light chain 5 [Streblomastix strix]